MNNEFWIEITKRVGQCERTLRISGPAAEGVQRLAQWASEATGEFSQARAVHIPEEEPSV